MQDRTVLEREAQLEIDAAVVQWRVFRPETTSHRSRSTKRGRTKVPNDRTIVGVVQEVSGVHRKCELIPAAASATTAEHTAATAHASHSHATHTAAPRSAATAASARAATTTTITARS